MIGLELQLDDVSIFSEQPILALSSDEAKDSLNAIFVVTRSKGFAQETVSIEELLGFVISDVDEVDDGIPRTMGSANLTPLGIFFRNFQLSGFVKMIKIENITQNATIMMKYISLMHK